MGGSLAAVGEGFAASLGHVLWVSEAWVGIIVTACTAVWAVLLAAGWRIGRGQPLVVVITDDAEVGDDTIAMVKGGTQPMDHVGAEVNRMLRKDKR